MGHKIYKEQNIYGYFLYDWECCAAIISVASLPKILQNDSKTAVEKNCLQRKIGGRTTAFFGEKRPKNFLG
jgi:hypothetical protein